MMLWLVLGIEALAIAAIFVQMMRKRSSLQTDDEDSAIEAGTPAPGLELPQEEKWE